MAPAMAHIPTPIELNQVCRDLQCAEQLAHHLYGRKINALIICGPYGIGKTHRCEKVAREHGQKWNPERPGSFIGLMRLFKQYAGGGVLVLDDIDELWSDSKALEVLQIALDTTERRFLSHSVGGNANSIERFELKCRVLFLSNLDFQDPKLLRTHGVGAVKSRSIIAPISFDPLALYEYTGWLCTAGGMLRKVFVDLPIGHTITTQSGERITITPANTRWYITREEANHMLQHFANYADHYPSIGPRELVKFARLRIGAAPDEWEGWIARQLTREPLWALPAPLYVYRVDETPPPAALLPGPVPGGGAASATSEAVPASPLSSVVAPAPPTVSKKRTDGRLDRDAYMTRIKVAERLYAQVVRILTQEGVDLSDLWWAEPCAGSGNILRQTPDDRRLGYDINPLDNGALGIVQADYTKQQLDPSRRWIPFTNVPFGRQPGDRQGGPQTLFEWAAAQSCVVAIAIIVPHWFQRHTIENRLNPYFHRVHREVLEPDSFTRDGQIRWCPAIFDVWVRRDYMRDPMVVRTTDPDWEFLPAGRIAEADCWMQNWGVGFGEIKDPHNLGRIQEPTWHWFLKELRPGTIERLARINMLEDAYPTVSTPRLHKGEMVAAYIAAYGNPEAPDYDPEGGRVDGEAAAPEAPAPTPPTAPPEALAATDPDSHPDLEWISARRGFVEAILWIARRGPDVGKIIDGSKQVPLIPGDYHALRCEPQAVAILRSIPWRPLAAGSTLSKRTISREYTRAKLAGLPK